MKRFFTLLGIGLISFYGQSQTLDQLNTASTGSGWLVDFGSYQSVGQSFTPGITGTLAEVVISLDATNGVYPIIAGNFTLSILNGNGYGGTVVGTETFTITGAEVSGDYSIPITSTISLTSGNSYTYIIDEISGTGRIMINASSNTYAAGDLYYSVGSPTVDAGRDFKFRTYMNVAGSCTIADQTINTADFSAICSKDTIIEIASSEVGVNYFLRDNANDSIISGPITGTGSALQFNTGNISSTTTYNVNATGTSGALNFDGVDDYVDLGTSPNFDIQSDITVETWVKFNTYPAAGDWYRLIGKGEFIANRTYGLWINDTGGLFWQMWGTTNLDLTGPTLALNTWYHVAATRSGNICEIFVNGVSVASTTYTGTPNLTTQPATIGAAVVMHDWLDGQMDEVRIWNVARTATEIQNNMGICLTGSETGLVANYDLNDGVGALAIDKSINGLDGTLTNGPTWTTGSSNVYCSSCDLQLSATPTITITPIANQTVAITDTELCFTNTGTTVTTASSEVGIYYYLRDNDNDTIVDGPIEGTGSGLTFNTGNLINSMDYNIYAVSSTNNTALIMDGVNEYVSTPNVVQDNSWTYETWVKPNDMSPEWSGIITSNSGIGSGMWFQLSLSNTGQLRWESNSPNLFIPNIGSVINDDIWHHIAVTCDGINITFYIDGIQVEQQPYSGGTMDRPLHVMAERVPNQWVAGQVDETMVWDYARASNEILSDMTTCLNGSESGLLIYFNYEDGVGSTVTDLAGGDHNGSLINMEDSDWTNNTNFILNCPDCDVEMTPTVTVNIQDVTGPTPDVTNLPDVTATCEVTSLTDPTATDNCSATVTVTNDATLPITMVGTTVVTWTYDDGNGNTSTQTQNVIVSDPNIDITTSTSGLTISANNTTATSYQWLDCGNSDAPISGETNASYTATVNGNYSVIVTEGNCSDTSMCVQISGVGIDELSNLGVEIYPNPNNGEFTISTTQNNVSITVYAIDGKIIINNLQITEANQFIHLGDIESGIYFVKVKNNINQKTIRLVIE